MPMDPATLPVGQRVALLVKALNGAQRTNEARQRDNPPDQSHKCIGHVR
jgi:hypothetical protein